MTLSRFHARRRRTSQFTGSKKRPIFERLEGRNLLAITIDTFDTMQFVEDPLTPPPVSVPSIAAPEAIGGTRELLAQRTSQFGELALNVNSFGSPLLQFDATASAAGTRRVTWDGDLDPNTLNPIGLGPTDLTQGGVNTRFEFLAGADLAGALATFTLNTGPGGATVTTASVAIPVTAGGALSPTPITLPFSSFVGADFTMLGAVRLEITGTPAVDGQIDEIIATGDPAIHIEKLTNGQDADVPTGPMITVGQMAMFTYQVTNTGAVPLATIVVSDNNGTPGVPGDDFNPTPMLSGAFNVGDTNMDNLLDLTETWLYSASRVVTAGQYTNIAVVTGTDPATQQTVTDDDPSNHFGEIPSAPAIHIEKLTNNQDADTPTGPIITVGQMAMFTYQVTNLGNVALSTIVVSDNNGTPGVPGDDFNPTPMLSGAFNVGDTNMDNLLDLTETWLYSASRVVTAGQYTNIAVVTGTDPATQQTVTDDDPSNHFGEIPSAPAIHIEKLTNNQDADTPTGPIITVGQMAMFTYQVTNPGNVALSTIVVSDNNGTPGVPGDDFNPTPMLSGAFNVGDTNMDNLLDLTETWLYSASRVVTAGQYTNIAVVTGTDPATQQTVTDDDPSNHFGEIPSAPAIHIEKLTNNQDADTPTGPMITVGQMAMFTYQVTNPGNVALSTIVVSDNNGTPGIPGDDFSPMPVLNGAFNFGDTDMDNLLDTNETWLYSAAHVVTAGQYTNIAVVTGTDPATQQTVTDDDPSNHFGQIPGAPAIHIEKLTNNQDADVPTGPMIPVGQNANFTYQVTNPGNVALSTIAVTDDNGTPVFIGDDFSPTAVLSGAFNIGDIDMDNLLDTNETWLYTAARVVTVGQYTNIAVVTGTDPATQQSVTDNDPSNHLGVTPSQPVIHIEKLTNNQDADVPTGPMIPVGQNANFTYQVTNPGTVALSTIVVSDNNGTPGNLGDDFSPTPTLSGAFNIGDTNTNNLLDPGETWLYTAARVVTAGQYTNIGKVTGTDPQTQQMVMDDDPSNHFGVIPIQPVIHIEKLTNNQDADVPTGPVIPVGQNANFTYQVTNPGTVALSTIVVSDNNGTPGNLGDDFSPTPTLSGAFNIGDTNTNNLLDPGETWLYSAVRIVTAGQYTNIGKVTGTDPQTQQMVMDDDPSNHFGDFQEPASISGKVFVDVNKNGRHDEKHGGKSQHYSDPYHGTHDWNSCPWNVQSWDPNSWGGGYQGGYEYGYTTQEEMELPGVQIILTRVDQFAPDRFTTTDEWGRYSFDNLEPGVYKVTQIQPREFMDGPNIQGTPRLGGVVEFIDGVVEDMFTDITLQAGVHAVDYNFTEMIQSKRDYMADSHQPKVRQMMYSKRDYLSGSYYYDTSGHASTQSHYGSGSSQYQNNYNSGYQNSYSGNNYQSGYQNSYGASYNSHSSSGSYGGQYSSYDQYFYGSGSSKNGSTGYRTGTDRYGSTGWWR